MEERVGGGDDSFRRCAPAGAITVTPAGGVPTTRDSMLTVTPPQWNPLSSSTAQADGTLTIIGTGAGTLRWNHNRLAWPVTLDPDPGHHPQNGQGSADTDDSRAACAHENLDAHRAAGDVP